MLHASYDTPFFSLAAVSQNRLFKNSIIIFKQCGIKQKLTMRNYKWLWRSETESVDVLDIETA